jgi:hypothetical protein
MSNLSENRINVVLSAADVTAMTNSIQTFLSKIPSNTSLDDAQRKRYNAINVANKVFAEDVLTEALLTGAGILPPFIDLTALQNDLTIFNQLDAQESALRNALQGILDAKRIAGHEAYNQANAIYGNYKNAAESGIANAKSSYDKLKVRYEAQGPSLAGRPADTNP